MKRLCGHIYIIQINKALEAQNLMLFLMKIAYFNTSSTTKETTNYSTNVVSQ